MSRAMVLPYVDPLWQLKDMIQGLLLPTEKREVLASASHGQQIMSMYWTYTYPIVYVLLLPNSVSCMQQPIEHSLCFFSGMYGVPNHPTRRKQMR